MMRLGSHHKKKAGRWSTLRRTGLTAVIVMSVLGGKGNQVSGSTLPSFGFRRRRGCERILRPVVIGVAATKLFADFLISLGPEAA